jgi:hypothetical protein
LRLAIGCDAAYECLEANDTLENVSAEDVAYVATVLRKKYGRPGKPKEELVFEVYYYVPDRAVSREDRAELVAKLIVDLQRPLPMEGMLVPRFPDKVERGYLDRVREFLPSEEGKCWSRWHTAHVDPKNPAANRVQLGSRWLRGAFTPICIHLRVTTPWR